MGKGGIFRDQSWRLEEVERGEERQKVKKRGRIVFIQSNFSKKFHEIKSTRNYYSYYFQRSDRKEIREYSQKKREEPAKLDLEEAKEEANKTLSSEISPKKTTFMKGYTNIFLIFLLLLCVYVHVCV